MEYAIRPMDFKDYDSVIALWCKTDGIELTDTDEKEPIQLFLDRNPGLSQVAHCGNELVGAVLCSYDGRRGYIHHLAVRREFRRHGIGSALVRECILRLRQVGIRKCNTFINPENQEALVFWQVNGFNMLPHFDCMQAIIDVDG
jgi:ribosomal protein S18 acetylase RimI-like enzyme